MPVTVPKNPDDWLRKAKMTQVWGYLGADPEGGVDALAAKTCANPAKLINFLGERAEHASCPDRIGPAGWLWRLTGADPDLGVNLLITETGADAERLKELLDPESLRASVPEAEASVWKSIWRWCKGLASSIWKGWKCLDLRRHLPDLMVLTVPALVLLILRATGVVHIAVLPRLEKVVVAKQDLEREHILSDSEVMLALEPREDKYFSSIDQVPGLYLEKSVRRGKPLRFDDVLQLVVVAAKDIQVCESMGSDSVSLEWKPYSPTAFRQASALAGARARHAIRRGQVILSDLVVMDPKAPCDQ